MVLNESMSTALDLWAEIGAPLAWGLNMAIFYFLGQENQGKITRKLVKNTDVCMGSYRPPYWTKKWGWHEN